MALPGREISVGWALFQWDGRIGRRVFMLGTKRLHDIGMPGMASVLLLLPAFSLILFFVLCVWPPVQDDNRYGPGSDMRSS